jgi:hypothetical protein
MGDSVLYVVVVVVVVVRLLQEEEPLKPPVDLIEMPFFLGVFWTICSQLNSNRTFWQL